MKPTISLTRMTRLYEGPGEKYHGRKSATPVIYQVHHTGCEKLAGERVLTEDEAAATVKTHCMRRRHLMTCMSCGSTDVAERLKNRMSK